MPKTQAEYEAFRAQQSEASNKAYQLGDYDLCRTIEQSALVAARRFGDRKEEAMSIYGIALVDLATGKPQDAERRFRESIVVWKSIGDQKGLALSLRGLGRVLENTGRLPEAAEVQVTALELLLKFGKPIDQSESYYSLARLFLNLENYPAALHGVDRAIALMGASPPDFPLGLNLGLRSAVLRELGRKEEALKDAEAAMAAFERNQSKVGVAIAQLALGHSLALNGQVDRGLETLRAGERTAKELNEAMLRCDLLLAEGGVLVRANRYEESLAPLDTALGIATELSLDQQLRNIQLEREKAFSGLDRPADALAASKAAFQAQTRLARLDQIGQLAGRSAESQLTAVNSRFLSLDPATRASQPVLAPITAKTTPLWWWWAGGLALAAILGWGVRLIMRLRHKNRRMRDDQRALADAHEQLQDRSAQLQRQVSMDPLTGTLSRRAFAEELAALLQYSQSIGRPVTLMVFDLDHFKQINDRHGHLTGDAALKLLVGLVREQLDSDDLFGRFGGDEFLIASREPEAEVAAMAERIRSAVEQRSTAPDSALPPLSVSIGLAHATRGTGYDAEQLFLRADAALYEAKAAGRNRVALGRIGQAAPGDPRSLLLSAGKD
ncbi:diguanylate cyclase [Arenimonas sp.]|uniref:tetratricopeptide repeat-containing diguanylate cyclase n=1 Tax=Arenimonas sp. TaxID=1872635 RepID=UPI0039E4ECFD